MIRVLISHPQTIFLEGVRCALSSQKEIYIVDCVSDIHSALDVLGKSKVDVVVSNMEMPYSNGLHIIREIIAREIDVKVILLTSSESPLMLQVAQKEGAMALLERNTTMETLIDTIKNVAKGINQELPIYDKSPKNISKREAQIYSMLITGLSIKEISLALGINEKTTSTYKRRLFDKLNINNIADLVRLGDAVI